MNLSLLMYANEPCRICGGMITKGTVKTDVFVGYSKDSKSRAAHLICWEKKIPRDKWKHQ